MPSTNPPIQRQIKLPLSKAVEIAYKSIRLRLSRSMLVTSSIILALAFLVSIMTTEAINEGMRTWIDIRLTSKDLTELRLQRDQLDTSSKALRENFNTAIQQMPKSGKDLATYNPKMDFGKSWDDLGEQLPASQDDLSVLLIQSPQWIEQLKTYFKTTKEMKAIRDQINAPEELRALLSSKGVPTEKGEIEGNRIQTRWLIGLALLVAFVGILNAMLMSVTERFREIGTMKCLGALDSFIVKLFLLESLFQGIVGTIFGLLLGLVISFAMALLTFGGYATMNVPWHDVGFAVVLSLIVGMTLSVGGAVYPAWQAARMEPIAAMRVEA